MNFSINSTNSSSCVSPFMVGPTLEFWPTMEFDRLVAEGCNCSSIVTANHVENVHCGPSPWIHSIGVQVVYIFLFGLIIALAIGGNSIVIWTVLAHERMRTVTNYFLLNLALSDALISLFNVCFSFTFNLYYSWFFGEAYCVFNNLMAVTPTCASVFTLMCMSLDRYVAIVYPLKSHLSRRKTILVIILIWVMAVVIGMPQLLYSYTTSLFFYTEETGPHQDILCMADRYPDGNSKTSRLFSIYNSFLLVIQYILPLILLTVTYSHVGCVLWGSQIGDHYQADSMKAKRKVVKMMICVVMIFMICWLPYHLYFTVFMKLFIDTLAPRTALYIYLNIYWLAMSSTIFNPIIYCWMNSRFRTGFRYVFRCLPFIHLPQQAYSQSELVRDPRKPSYSVVMHRMRQAPIRKRPPHWEKHSGAENGRLLKGNSDSEPFPNPNSPVTQESRPTSPLQLNPPGSDEATLL